MSVLNYTPYDQQTWQRIRENFGVAKDVVARVEQHQSGSSELARDLFWCFYQIEPELDHAATDLHKEMISDLLVSSDYRAMRERVGDDTLKAALVGLICLEQLVQGFTAGYALDKAKAELDRLDQAMAAFAARDPYKPLPLTEQMALADKTRQSPKLRAIAKIAGRLKKLAIQVHATRTPDIRDDVREITQGNDLANVLPGELALLGLPQTAPLTYQRYSEKRLLQRERDGKEEAGQGPIIVALDSSGSMLYGLDGDREVPADQNRECWSKALMLALREIAMLEKRDLAVIHFGGTSDQVRTWHFSSLRNTANDVADCAQFFYRSGMTKFDYWMREALRLVDSSKYDKADVIVLSDGAAYVGLREQRQWEQRREQRGMRSYGILIGPETQSGGLAFVCDQVFRMSNLDDENELAKTVFAI